MKIGAFRGTVVEVIEDAVVSFGGSETLAILIPGGVLLGTMMLLNWILFIFFSLPFIPSILIMFCAGWVTGKSGERKYQEKKRKERMQRSC